MGDQWEMDKVEIGGFKSYGESVMIGPFKRFTCIVGPNGSGKSNVMDALSFVLGVDRKHLRSQKYVDLIHRKENEDPAAAATRAAKVTLRMRRKDGQDGSLVFERAISPHGATTQRVDGILRSFDQYVARLAEINVIVKAKNFLVFQGDVDGLASHQGKALTELIEKVSGSAQFAEEYERLQKEKATAESATRDVLSKKRCAMHEKKQLAQQRDEALAFQKATDEFATKKVETFLLRLFRLSTEQAALQERTAKRQHDHQTCKELLEQGKKDVQELDRQRARLRIEGTQLERDIGKRKAAVDQLKPQTIGAETRAATLSRRIVDLQEELKQEKTRAAQQTERRQQFVTERGTVNKKLAQLKEQRSKQGPLDKLTPAQLAEIARVQAVVEQASRDDTTRARQLEADVEQAKVLWAARRDEQKELDQRHSGLVAAIEDMLREEDRLKRAVDFSTEQLHEVKQKRKNQHEVEQQSVQQRQQLEQEKEQLLLKLQLLNASYYQVQREKKQCSIVQELKQFFPGVEGRFVELVLPVQKRLSVAVSVAMGKLGEAVIVDTSATGQRCIEHLKERLYDPMTFIPLDDIRVPKVDPSLNRLTEAQLALKCVTYDAKLEKAVTYVFGETLFVDTLKTARDVAFKTIPAMRSQGVKVVTLTGERISKNCNMSVDTDTKVSRYEIQQGAVHEARVKAIAAELQQLSQQHDGSSDTLHETTTRALEDKVQFHALRLERLSQGLTVKKGELQSVEQLRKERAPEVEKLLAMVHTTAHEAETVRTGILQHGKKHYKALSDEIGIPDVGTALHEQKRYKARCLEEETASLARCAQLSAEIELLDRGQSTKLEQDLQHCQDLHKDAAAKATRLRTELDKLEAEASSVVHSANEKEAGDKQLEEQYRTAKEAVLRYRQQSQQFVHLEGQDAARDKAIHVETKDVLRTSLFQDVRLPVEIRDESQSQSELTQTSMDAVDRGAQFTVCYDALPAAANGATQRELDKLFEDAQRECEKLEAEVGAMRPNLKALERFSDVADKVSETNQQADDARKLSSELDRQFAEVKRQRREKFLHCYAHIAAKIDAIYRELTTYSDDADGGNAYLDLEDEDEPYLRGVTFTTRVPSKRFRELNLQSGGERTVAALSLLFALHSYAAPPFLILDEVDAALDSQHVEALVRFLQQAEFQAVVISLKDKLYSESQALVGVYKTKDHETSKVLTLDLEQYA